jgi:hypothetical protein
MIYRILKPVARIYVKAPRVRRRPEPIKTALGKLARAVERYSVAAALAKHPTNIFARTLERNSRRILKEFVETHPSPIYVIYITPGEHTHKSETFCSSLS